MNIQYQDISKDSHQQQSKLDKQQKFKCIFLQENEENQSLSEQRSLSFEDFSQNNENSEISIEDINSIYIPHTKNQENQIQNNLISPFLGDKNDENQSVEQEQFDSIANSPDSQIFINPTQNEIKKKARFKDRNNLLKSKKVLQYQELANKKKYLLQDDEKSIDCILTDRTKNNEENQEQFNKKFKQVRKLSVRYLKNVPNTIKLIRLIRKIIYKLKINMRAKTMSLLREKHINIILDYVYFKMSVIFSKRLQVETSKLEKAYNFFSGKIFMGKWISVLEKMPLIIPTHKIYLFWNIFSILAIVCNMFIFTIDLVMGEHDMYWYYQAKWTGFNVSILIMYILDILFKFNTQVYDSGFILKKKRQIAYKYVHNQFIYDVIILIPFILEMSHMKYPFKFWNLLVYLKLGTYKQIINDVSNMIISNKTLTHLLSIMRLVLFICFIAHLFGCAWQGLATLCTTLDWDVPNWIETKGKRDAHWLEIYIWSFYFAVTTMTTIGYGDITPSNVYEACLLIVGMVVATFTFAVTFNAIGQIVQELQKDHNEYINQIQLVKLYLNNKNCSEELRYEVQQYLEQKHQESKILTNEEQKFVVSKLPEHIQEQIIFESFIHIINHNKNLFGQFSLPCQFEIASRFKEAKVEKGQIIYTDSEEQVDILEHYNDPCFYHIEAGEVMQYMGNRYAQSTNHDKSIQKIKKDSYFGEYSFFSGNKRECSAKVTKAGVINYIKRSSFVEALQMFPLEYEIFCMQKDKLVYNENNSGLQIKCVSCNKYGHYLKDCPLLHFIPDKEKIILKSQYSIFQGRKDFYIRKGAIRWNAILDQQYILNQRQLIMKKKQQKKVQFEQNPSEIDQINEEIPDYIVDYLEGYQQDSKMSLDYQDIDKDNQEFEEKLKKQKDKKQRQSKQLTVQFGDSILKKSNLSHSNSIKSVNLNSSMRKSLIPLKYQKMSEKEPKPSHLEQSQQTQLSFLFTNKKKKVFGKKIFQMQNVNRLHTISNKSEYIIDEFEEPIYFVLYYPSYNFDIDKMVLSATKYKDNCIQNSGFGIYNFQNRKIHKTKSSHTMKSLQRLSRTLEIKRQYSDDEKIFIKQKSQKMQ